MQSKNEYSLKAFKKIKFNAIFNSYDISICEVNKALRKEREKDYAKEDGLEPIFISLCDLTGMMLTPNSINEPFSPVLQWHDGSRSAIASDFTEEELSFFEKILPTLNVYSLKARVADVLWVCGKPKNPEYAKIAIDSYINDYIDEEKWHSNQKNSYKRAYILAKTLKANARMSLIKGKLLQKATEYNDKLLLSISRTLVDLRVPHNQDELIANNLQLKARNLGNAKDFMSARDCLKQALKHIDHTKQKDNFFNVKYLIAETWRLDAEQKFNSDKADHMLANYNFKGAIQAYRDIPKEYREQYNVEVHIKDMTDKLRVSGEKLLETLNTIQPDTSDLDLDKLQENAKLVISKSSSKIEALYRFCSLFPPVDINIFRDECQKVSKKGFLSNLFGSSHYAADGRLIAKTEAKGLDENEISLDDMVKTYTELIPYHVGHLILPAMEQLLHDYSIEARFLYELNHKSGIVPQHQLNLMTEGLRFGFEYDFSMAIHLLAPLLESLVRQRLNSIGVTTIHIDAQDIEQELGLSSLLDKEEIVDVFSEGVVFELKAVFTNQIGPNLRNNVAHGLLSDHSSRQLTSVYGWYIVLRTIIYALIHDSWSDEE